MVSPNENPPKLGLDMGLFLILVLGVIVMNKDEGFTLTVKSVEHL